MSHPLAPACAQALDKLLDVANTALRDWPEHYPEGRAIGYLCSYVPKEIIHAAGFTPVRIRGGTGPIRLADSHLQSFTCALCRSSLEQSLTGELGFLEGVVFAHTCDAMQALADLWKINAGSSHYVDVLMQPTNLGSVSARAYLISELGRFRERLGAFAGSSITDDALRASVGLYNTTRHLVHSLDLLRDRLSGPQFFGVLDAAQLMPREVCNPLLAEVVESLAGGPVVRDGPQIFIVGAVLDEPRLLHLIHELGGRIVGDDVCSGSRHFHGLVGNGEPIAAIADHYLLRPPCPTKFHPLHDPGRSLLDQVRQVRAQGIVFILEKFCEPHAFDYTLALPALDRAGIPHMLLEMEQMPSLEALRTRLQAFFEML